VTKLREHWEETNAKVMQRKAQLDALLVDSQRYESKKQEVEAWLARMEARMERMGPVGHTADVLEAQLREQKVNWPSKRAEQKEFSRAEKVAARIGMQPAPRINSNCCISRQFAGDRRRLRGNG